MVSPLWTASARRAARLVHVGESRRVGQEVADGRLAVAGEVGARRRRARAAAGRPGRPAQFVAARPAPAPWLAGQPTCSTPQSEASVMTRSACVAQLARLGAGQCGHMVVGKAAAAGDAELQVQMPKRAAPEILGQVDALDFPGAAARWSVAATSPCGPASRSPSSAKPVRRPRQPANAHRSNEQRQEGTPTTGSKKGACRRRPERSARGPVRRRRRTRLRNRLPGRRVGDWPPSRSPQDAVDLFIACERSEHMGAPAVFRPWRGSAARSSRQPERIRTGPVATMAAWARLTGKVTSVRVRRPRRRRRPVSGPVEAEAKIRAGSSGRCRCRMPISDQQHRSSQRGDDAMGEDQIAERIAGTQIRLIQKFCSNGSKPTTSPNV